MLTGSRAVQVGHDPWMHERVAVVSDIHGNPWALRAVLEEVRLEAVDLVVNCGDLTAGPWPVEVIDDLMGCGVPVLSVRGNGDRMVCDAYDGRWDDIIGPARAVVAWAADHIRATDRRWLGLLPLTAEVEVSGLGRVGLCHATPRSDEEILLPTSDEARVQEVLHPLTTPTVVYGHTHVQDDRLVAGRRVVNAGSVGKPFDRAGAAWLLLGPDVELRRTRYDLELAAAAATRRMSRSAEARAVAEDFVRSILERPGRDAVLELMAEWELAQVGHLAARSRQALLDDPPPG